MDLGLTKRHALVTVASRGLGRAIVGRYGDAAEFASVAAFLASPLASYMTGGVIRVDGGMIRSV
jgi:3-oxoacyl-[acyl-carrier protein] reductase